MRNIHRIPDAIADLESQNVPNVKATAEKYDVARKTLENRGCAVNKNWNAAFVRRHKDEAKSLYLKSIDIKRVKGEYAAPYELFYKLLLEALEDYSITADNIWNIGFLIRMGSKMRRIRSREAYEQERLAAQHEIDKHLQSGLQETLKNEKKRRQRGKRLNLLGEEDSGGKSGGREGRKGSKEGTSKENKQRREAEVREKTLQRQVEKEAKARAKAEERF
ncbi:hypothetical protein V8E54_004836 [Elaphomyces granulatus]